MKSIVRHCAGHLAPAGVAVLLAACGGTKPPQTPAAAVPEPVRQASARPSPLDTATAANVSIAPDILRACNIPEADAYFPFDSARLTRTAHGPLDRVEACFTHGPLASHRLELVGHADPRGSSDYNMTLGQARADAVAGYLGAKGLPRSQETATSRGALDSTGSDEAGWARDRRVDVMLAR
jgi:peptidoglycan-associated lipoprotein